MFIKVSWWHFKKIVLDIKNVCIDFILVANWGLPLAAMSDMKRDPEFISGKMTTGKADFVDVVLVSGIT